MNERDRVRRKHDPPRGILNVSPAQATQGLARYWPSADLAPFVEHYWIVRWDLAEPRTAETVPQPSVHMVLETERTEVVGVMHRKFSRRIEGRGRVVGTKFWPGGFRAFVDRPVAAFTDRRLAVEEVFGPRAAGLAPRALAHDVDEDSIAVVESFLRARRPRADDVLAHVRAVAQRIAEDRALLRVDDVATAFATTVRSLQRAFREYVGVTPKWVIQRFRLLEAAERLAAGKPLDGARLAADLGYADQAHFIRDFKAFIGRSPADYARSIAG